MLNLSPFGIPTGESRDGVHVEDKQAIFCEVRPHPGERKGEVTVTQQVVHGVVEREHKVEVAQLGQIPHVRNLQGNVSACLLGGALQHGRREIAAMNLPSPTQKRSEGPAGSASNV